MEADAEFDAQFRDVLKESTADVSAKLKSGAGLLQIERNIEQRLGGNIKAAAKTATLAASSKRLIESAAALQAGPTGAAPDSGAITKVTRMTVLRRGANDKPEARAILVPDGEFTQRIAESRREHQKEADELKTRTLAMTRAQQLAAEGGGRRGR